MRPSLEDCKGLDDLGPPFAEHEAFVAHGQSNDSDRSGTVMHPFTEASVPVALARGSNAVPSWAP